jgi:hypothetical protein
MTLCPVALAVGCRKCPIFSICPVKTVIGDQEKAPTAPPSPTPSRPAAGKKTRGRRKGR